MKSPTTDKTEQVARLVNSDSKVISIEDGGVLSWRKKEIRIKDTLVSTNLSPDDLAIVNEVKNRAESGFNKFKQPMQSVMRARMPIDMGEPETWASIARRLDLTEQQAQKLYKQGCDLIDLARNK